MVAGIHQPYFIPYIGYWQLIDAVDIFAAADNYNYIKRGWINRNRVACGDEIKYFNVEVDHASQNRFICDHRLKPIDRDLKLKQLKGYYHGAPCLNEGLDLMDRVLSFEGDNLADFLVASIRTICDYLRIDTKIIRTSDLDQDPELHREDRIYDYCRQLGADEYYNLIGGMELYRFEEFAQHGLKLSFVDPVPMPYPKYSGPFVFGLSILDVIMKNPVDDIQPLLKSRRIIWEQQK